MMEIKLRRVSPYVEATVSEGQTIISLGLLDKDEREMLATQLRSAADQLSDQATLIEQCHGEAK